MSRWTCGIFGLFSLAIRHQLYQPTQIEIFSRHENERDTWNWAVLTCDPAIDHNIISHQLVVEVLQVLVQPIDEKMEPCIHTYGRGEKIIGYVDLTWCFEKNNRRMQTTRFWVTSTENPSYDAILGRTDAEQCGLIRHKRRWLWSVRYSEKGTSGERTENLLALRRLCMSWKVAHMLELSSQYAYFCRVALWNSQNNFLVL